MNLPASAVGNIYMLAALFRNLQDSRAHLGPPPETTRRQGPMIAVSDYRVFSSVVFVGIVAMDVWSDLKWSPFVSTYVVGPSSVLLWVMTLVGSFGIGPVRRAWDGLYASRPKRVAALAEPNS